MRIYQAGPLFSEADRKWHQNLKAMLAAAGHEPIWPGDLVSQADVARWGKDAVRQIMETDRAALDSCDLVLALLDGAQVDDGTAWEIGYAFARNIPIIGIRTDFRQAGETAGSRVNAMIEASCVKIVRSAAAATGALEYVKTQHANLAAYKLTS